MRSYLILSFVFILMLTSISADSIGTFKEGDLMQITNFCEAGVCTFINLTSIEFPNKTIIYPNAAMTQNGQSFNYSFTPPIVGEYAFITCGDSLINVCDRDTFLVNYNGNEDQIITYISLLIFLAFCFAGMIHLNKVTDYEKWYLKIIKKHESKDYIKIILSSIAYNFVKEVFAILYFIGLLFFMVLSEIIFTYNITALVIITRNFMFVYTLGIMIIGIMLYGHLQEFIVSIIDDFRDSGWGLGGWGFGNGGK